MFDKILNFYNPKKLSYKILLALFSIFLTKSIFLFPFTLVSGILGVLIGICIVALVNAALIFALFFTEKITWEYNSTPVKPYMILLYMLPTLALYGFLLAVVFPGIIPYDSLYIWEMTKTGAYTSLHPIIYTLYVNVLNSIIDSPWIVVAVQILYTSFAFSMIAVTFQGMGLKRRWCWATVLILALYPVNAMNTATMLKDVNYMVSLMLISVIIVRAIVAGKVTPLNIAALFVAALIALFSRHNALITIVVSFLILAFYLLKAHKKTNRIVFLLLAVLIVFFGTNKIAEISLGENYWKRSGFLDIAMIPSAQLAFTVDQNWYELTDSEYALAYKYLNLGYVTETVKQRPDWKFNHIYIFTLDYGEIEKDPLGFAKFYFDFWRAYPSDMMLEYQQITGIAWAIPNYGYTLPWNTGIAQYSSYDLGIYEKSAFPAIRAFIYQKPSMLFVLRPALWLMLSIFAFFAFYTRHKFALIAIASPMLANAFGYFLGSPAQNVRYLYCNFSIFIILVLFSTMSKKTHAN